MIRILLTSLPAQLGALAIAAWAALGLYGWHKERVGAAVVVVEINRETERLTHEAIAAREPASLPGAAGRLRKVYCRDCGEVKRETTSLR